MLNAYCDLRRSAWIACAIIDGEWIEGESFQTWAEADVASRFLIAAVRSSSPPSDPESRARAPRAGPRGAPSLHGFVGRHQARRRRPP